MKRSHRQTRNLFIPKWGLLSSINWRRGGLWWVFIPLSGAIAIFWKPMANPDTLNQMGNNISSNLQTLLSPITPYINTLQDTLERVQNIDPVQPSLARPEESEEFDSTLPTGSDILSDSELQQVIAALSLEEIGQEIESLSPPSLSVSFDLSPSTPKGKNQKKSPLSASHPLVSSVPYWSRKPAQPEPEENKDNSNSYLYPTVTSILNPDKDEQVESVDSNLPTYTSSIFTPNLTTKVTTKVTSSPQLPQTSLSRYSPPQIPTSSSASPSEPRSFGYSRLSPFVNTDNELTPPNPFNPQPQFTAPSGSIRPRGYGLIEPTTSLSNQQ
ncbi:hypothetical protein PMG71_02155 [Roseofilum sp. BLCC_M154]|uniref:Uncharacterized protein n=1 Tax=Roseofilum acuticapitatum BLCC-M154 TaxID=3022444 RepID=A0ABT7AP56_9CYAN|nr:hypothetical protein [Roseofilum acuticapitatum]MDJ1168229.1 hypothetical protein [Roseofilum acuticapitatum BLCC-M154]